MNGLKIESTDFDKLPQKQQLRVLYDNTEELKDMVSGFKFQQKLQWAAIAILFILTGFSKYLGVI